MRWAGVFVACAALLTGCTNNPRSGYIELNGTDLTRLIRLWNDPWVAGDTTNLRPSTTTQVSRGNVTRSYEAPDMSGDGVAVAEVNAALASGWTLTGASCSAAINVTATGTSVSLKKGGPDVDSAMVAAITVIPTTGVTGFVTVTVTGFVPNHEDSMWTDVPAVTLGQTCLGGASPGVAAQPGLSNRPYGATSRGATKGSVPAWWSSSAPSDAAPAVAAANQDPLLAKLGITAGVAPWTPSTFNWTAPNGSAPAGPAIDLAATVSQAGADGWALVYTGCWATGLTIAELRRDADAGHTLELRLTSAPSDADPATTVTKARVLVASPQWGGPPTGGATSVQACWSGTSSAGFETTGTPWFAPTALAPVLGS